MLSPNRNRDLNIRILEPAFQWGTLMEVSVAPLLTSLKACSSLLMLVSTGTRHCEKTHEKRSVELLGGEVEPQAQGQAAWAYLAGRTVSAHSAANQTFAELPAERKPTSALKYNCV